MGVIVDYGLSDEDVEFLLAIQELHENPQDYDNTEKGETPANTTALREATDLSKGQVDYRMQGGTNNRGLGEDEKGLVRYHSATIEEKTFGPRSAELTEKGVRVVSEIRQSENVGDSSGDTNGADSSRVSELEEAVSNIEKELENISGIVEAHEESRMGAMDSEEAERFDLLKKLVPTHRFLFKRVLGIDPDRIQGIDPEDEEAMAQLRREMFQQLSEPHGGVESVSDGNDDGADSGSRSRS